MRTPLRAAIAVAALAIPLGGIALAQSPEPEAAHAKIADAAGVDCWLETSVPGNMAFYERRGFLDRIEVTIDAGPTTWWMRRPPRS